MTSLNDIIKTDLRQLKDLNKKALIKEIRALKERQDTIVSLLALIQIDGTQEQEYKDNSVKLEQLINDFNKLEQD